MPSVSSTARGRRPRAVLETEGTVFPNTARPRPVNNIYVAAFFNHAIMRPCLSLEIPPLLFCKTCCAKRPQIKLRRKEVMQEILYSHGKKTANLDSRQKEKEKRTSTKMQDL